MHFVECAMTGLYERQAPRTTERKAWLQVQHKDLLENSLCLVSKGIDETCNVFFACATCHLHLLTSNANSSGNP